MGNEEVKTRKENKGFDFRWMRKQEELKKSNICEHLRPLELEIISGDYHISSRGQAWQNVGEWVYFECYLDKKSIIKKYNFPDFVKYHEHLGTHDGREAGFFCQQCKDGVMGVHSVDKENYPVFIAKK